MKIAFVHQPLGGTIQPGRHADSLTILVYELATRLAQSCDVVVYSPRGPDQPEVETFQGVEYRRLSPAYDSDFMLRCLKRLSRFRNRRRPLVTSNFFHRRYINRVAHDLREQNCDFVFVQTLPQYPGIIRKLNPSTPIALNMQCEWLNQFDRGMISRQLEAVDLVLGCSEYITEQARLALPEHAAKCRTLLNGCDLTRFQSARREGPDAPKRLLFVNRVSPEKGAHVLMDAFLQIARTHPEAELDIVGPEWIQDRSFFVHVSEDVRVKRLSRYYDRSYLAALKEKVPPQLAGKIRFSGVVPHEELVDYYAKAYALIYPSVWDEPFGLPIIEGMAAGLPVIASSTGGIPELVEYGKAGLLVPPGDTSALASAVRLLLDDANLWHALSRAGHKRAVSKFSWERMAGDLLTYMRSFPRRSAKAGDELAKNSQDSIIHSVAGMS
jgi:glycosyltransferase involved in cell wall biosynthesis